jgi:cell division protease FtsH
MNFKSLFKGPWLWIILIAGVVIGVLSFSGSADGYREVKTATMVGYFNDAKIKDVEFVDGDQEIRATLEGDGAKKVKATWLGQDQGTQLVTKAQQLVDDDELASYNVKVPPKNTLLSVLLSFLPFVIFILIFLWLMNSMQGGGGRVMQFAKSKAKLMTKDTPQTTFADVAGCDEAIEELGEIKEFLQEPAKFQAVGAKIPKGVLLYGPPGTGKTLLARAVAGEAGVPFYSISGSDFVEMFVGVGASRVRDLFEQAKDNAPAIVFIDEIDAVGRHRGTGMGGGHDEREQTLNQLLVEMDGFDVRGGVILIAATNRPDVDLEAVARRTPGFSGADLANVLNEAALLTARDAATTIDNAALDEAIDRVISGPQKRSRLMNEHERLVTAYHEGGHALVAAALPQSDPVHKITILPRGRALGYTMVLPDEDKYSQTRAELLDKLAYMLGGRAAEELVFHDPTTGAGNDIEKATSLARAMVTQYGMSERIGAVRFGEDNGQPFLGRDIGHSRNYSEDVAATIDDEISGLIKQAHQEAFDILVENRHVLDELVRELMEKETLDKAQVARIFEALNRRDIRPAWTGSELRQPSSQPPIVVPQRNGDAPEQGIVVGPDSGSDAPAPDAPQPGESPTI